MKYRQKGYRDDEYAEDRRREAKRDEKPPDLGNREQIRSLRHAIDRETIVVTAARSAASVPRASSRWIPDHLFG
jgi:hypothetical protein